MNLPDEIIGLAHKGLIAMRHGPDHHYNWRIRRDIYQWLKQNDPHQGKLAHGWIAVLTAQKVLPIFDQTFPEDTLPSRLLSLASQVVQGQVPGKSEQVMELLEAGYQTTGIDNFSWRKKTVYNAEYAGSACYKALLEASGVQDLLEHIEQDGKPTRMFLMNRPPDQVTDEDIAHLAAYSDTASSAAIAYACDPHQFVLNHDKLQHFWEWWVESALPEAWQKASIQPEKTHHTILP